MAQPVVLFLFLLNVVIGLPSQASPFSSRTEAECTARDLRAPLGPNRPQGDIGWCYANAAADLLTYRYQKQLAGQRASAGYVALRYNRHYLQSPLFEGGFASLALRSSQRHWICPQDIEDKMLKKGPQVGIKKKLQGLLYLWQNYQRTGGTSLNEDLRKYFETNHSVLVEIPEVELRKLIESSTEKTFPAHLADHLCRGHEIEIAPRDRADVNWDLKYLWGGATSPLIWRVQKELDRNNIIGVSYFADFFDQDGAAPTEASRHVSVIVGRRWSRERHRCELMIRNSWGSACNYKAASLKQPGMCEAGNLWVGEEYFSKYIFGLSYLEPTR